jgi:hypothetical protein
MALADLPVQTVPPGDDKIVVVTQGQPAPFTGQLFDNNTALRWGNWLQQYKFRLTLDVDTQKKLDQIQIDLLAGKLQFERDQYKVVTGDYQVQVATLQEELRNPPWYKSPWFGFGCGIVASVVLVSATAFVIHETK